jgi:hypothetical protein
MSKPVTKEIPKIELTEEKNNNDNTYEEITFENF